MFLIFFSTFWKITVGGFENQLIKNSDLNLACKCISAFNLPLIANIKETKSATMNIFRKIFFSF